MPHARVHLLLVWADSMHEAGPFVAQHNGSADVLWVVEIGPTVAVGSRRLTGTYHVALSWVEGNLVGLDHGALVEGGVHALARDYVVGSAGTALPLGVTSRRGDEVRWCGGVLRTDHSRHDCTSVRLLDFDSLLGHYNGCSVCFLFYREIIGELFVFPTNVFKVGLVLESLLTGINVMFHCRFV